MDTTKTVQRVQVPVWTDTWMMGDRYGAIVKITKGRSAFHKAHGHEIAHVLLDKSNKIKRFLLDDLELI